VSDGPVLFFDGDCAMCSRAVRFVLAADRSARVSVAPLGGATAAEFATHYPLIGTVNSLVFVTGHHAWVRSDGALRVLMAMGGAWGVLAWVARVVPKRWRDVVYDAVAARRQRWSAAMGPCPLLPAHVRHRVLP
jgi:predicted DCC family thiol-disulfide oxidoreductase YuxK